MPLGRLAGLVASMPSWVTLIIEQDELDLNPPAGRGQYQQPSTDKLGEMLDQHVTKARESLANTNDEYLMTTKWRLLSGGKVVMEAPRHVVLRDTLNHLAHHRGQLTVYLRLNDQTVPAIYGPSADDQPICVARGGRRGTLPILSPRLPSRVAPPRAKPP